MAPGVAEKRGAAQGIDDAAVLGFVLTVVIVHSLGADGSGRMFTAIGVVTIVAAICCAGADTGLLWALARLPDGGRPGALLVVALAPGLALSAAVAVAGATWGESTEVRLAFVAVPIVVVATVLLSALRSARPIGAYLALQSIAVPVARPLLVGAAVVAGATVTTAFAAWTLPMVAAAAIAVLLLVVPLRLRDGLRPHREQWRTFWAFTAPRGLSAAIDAGSMWVGVLMTAALSGGVQAGIFGAVGRYVLAGLLVMQGLRLALAPQLSRLLGSGRTAAAAAVYRRTSMVIIALSWPGYAVLATFAPGFLRLFGTEFAAGATAMAVLCAAMLVNSGAGIVQTVLLMSGNSGRHLGAAAAGLAGNLVLGVALIPRFGALGAAIAWSVAIVVENVLAALAARRVLGEPLFDRLTRRVAAGALAVGLAAAAVAVPLGRGVTGLSAVLAGFTVAVVVALLHPRSRAALRLVLKEHVRDAA